MASAPCLITDTKTRKTSSSSPSTSSSFSIDTILSSNPLSAISAVPQEAFNTFPWGIPTTYPFVSMLCSPLLPPFLPPFQHFVSRRKRRHRTIFSEEQLNILESTFLSTHYPDVATREKLAIQCSLKEERVEVWFKNRRAKDRKQKRDDTSGRNSKLSDESECDDSDEEVKRVKRIKKEKESSSPESKSSNAISSSSPSSNSSS